MCRRDGTQSNPIVRKTELRREIPCSTSEPPAIFSLVPGGIRRLAVGAVPGDDGPREGTSSRVNHDNHTPPAGACPSARSEPQACVGYPVHDREPMRPPADPSAVGGSR